MVEPILDPALAQQIVVHAEASRCLAMAGFTILVWDHICTFQEEVELLWSAPTSIVKILFLGNRYIAPLLLSLTVYQMSRLAKSSDEFCKVWIVFNGFAEISSLASSDLLLLLRVHVLWHNRRGIVIGTILLYILTYTCIGTMGLLSAIDIIPHLHFDPLAKQCATDHKPKTLPLVWTLSLILELVVFFMTGIKAFQNQGSDRMRSPLLKALYYDQLMYYSVVVFIRVFNVVIWFALARSLFLLGLFFIWSIIIAMVSRIILHLRSVAVTNNTLSANASFFGDSSWSSSRIAHQSRPPLQYR